VTNVHELVQDLLMSAALAGMNYGYFESAFMFKINILGQNMYNFGIRPLSQLTNSTIKSQKKSIAMKQLLLFLLDLS
jgi:hypothetical protein